MRIFPILSALTVTVTLLIPACGGFEGPDEIRLSLKSPTGSIHDTDALIAADEKLKVVKSAMFLGDLTPLSASSAAVLEQSVLRGISSVLEVTPGGGERLVQQGIGTPVNRTHLNDSCFESDNQTVRESDTKMVLQFREKFDVSKCVDDVTGTFEVVSKGTVTGKFSQNRIDSVEMFGAFTFTNLCEQQGDRACTNGMVRAYMSVTGAGEVDVFDFKLPTFYEFDITVTWDEQEVRQSLALKGGMFLEIGLFELGISAESYSPLSESYIEVSSQTGLSSIYTIETLAGDSRTFEIRGVDGTAACTGDFSTNAVHCDLDDGSTIDWTQQDIDRVTIDPSIL